MRLDVSLQQKQQLQLRLAPQMIQAIEILQLPNIDLKDRIDLELAENEVLEVEEETSPALEATDSETADDAPSPDGPEGEAPGADAPDEEFSSTIERLTSMAEEDREAGLFRSRGEGQEASDRKLEALQATAAPPPSLQDMLADQLTLLDAPEKVEALARALLYCLDDDGLLPIPPLARPVLAAMDPEGNLQRPLQEVVEGAGAA
ncbi:MAG: hypothetical protein HUU06_12690, partial [Planctomycetaceae bacterium]|nr:hypothetical protein [Planctomycetaceae bacterium]